MDEGVLVRWFHARDVFLGLNHHNNVARPYAGRLLAEELVNEVEEAAWLCSVISRDDTLELMRTGIHDKFVAEGSRRGHTYAYFCLRGRVAAALVDLARLGCPLAQGYCALYHNDIFADEFERVQFAVASALNGEPHGLMACGIMCFDKRLPPAQAGSYFGRAARLGFRAAMVPYAKCCFVYDSIERYEWLARSIGPDVRDHRELWHLISPLIHDIFVTGLQSCRLLYPISKALSKHGWKVGQVFGAHKIDFDCVLSIYPTCTNQARSEIRAWCLVAKRNRIYKDVRVMISKMLWARRADVYAHDQIFGKPKNEAE
jgi:hypothetical protein